MSRMKSFLGLPDATDKVIRLAKIMGILGPLANVIFTLSTTFWVIFIQKPLLSVTIRVLSSGHRPAV